MLTPRFATPLRFRVEGSRPLQGVVIAFVLLSLWALLLTPLPASFSTLAKPCAALLLLALSLRGWRGRAELGGMPVELTLRPNGMWLLERDGESTPLQLLGQSTVSPALLLLCFAGPQGQRGFDCLLWQGALPPSLWRRLRVYLRLYARDTLQTG